MRAPCSIDGCEKPSAGRGWCSMHWYRWRHHGDPLVASKPQVARPTVQCAASGCDRAAFSKGWCGMHYKRVSTHGSPDIVSPGGRPIDGQYPKYAAIHKRLTRARGSARLHACVDCGGRAREWSYDNRDPHEVRGQVGRFVCAYSLKLEHYEPRCTPCHRKFDFRASKGAAHAEA